MVSQPLMAHTRINRRRINIFCPISLPFLHIMTQVSFSSYDSLIYSLLSKEISILKVPQSSMRQIVMANSDKVRIWKKNGHDLFQVTIVANWEGDWEKLDNLQPGQLIFRPSFEPGMCPVQIWIRYLSTSEEFKPAILRCRDFQRQRVTVSLGS